jgi:hypothetical protein
VQLFVPAYVPAIVVFVTPLAEPLMLALHVGEAEMDPTGKLMVNESEDPDTVPDSVPLKSMSPFWLEAVTVADTLAADWFVTQVMLPGPLESEVVPA